MLELMLRRAPIDSIDSKISRNDRVSVPRMSAVAVRFAIPDFCGGSAKAPTGKYPDITTDGLKKFSRTSTTIPLGRVYRAIDSGPGILLLSIFGSWIVVSTTFGSIRGLVHPHDSFGWKEIFSRDL